MFRTVCLTTGLRTLAIHLFLITLITSLLPTPASAADKTDVVVMNNGDRFIGEIKQLNVGQLEFKASYMASSVNLDWTRVSELESKRRFRVEFADGTLRTGSIIKVANATAGANFEVTDDLGTTARPAFTVVGLEPIEGSFWSRFRGSADVGLTLQPELGQTQWTGNVTLDFPAESFRIDTQLSTFFSRQEGAEDSIRDSYGLTYYQFLSRKWFLFGMTQLLKDNQLNLDLRATVAGGPGRFLLHSNNKGLSVIGGFAATKEKYFDTASDRNGTNAEALAGMEFYLVRFASSQIKTRVLAYAGLTQWGRYRVDWESSISWEIWNDVYWKTSVLENFDSRPPEGASHNDFTLTSSFGLTF